MTLELVLSLRTFGPAGRTSCFRYAALETRLPIRLTRGWQTFFSDECSVQNNPNKPSEWVWRYSHGKYRPDLVNNVSHVKPTISQMVFGVIWREGRSQLVLMQRDATAPRNGYTANSYMRALEEGLLPYYDQTRHFQQDNARIHTAIATEAFLMRHRVSVIEWPAHRPDLNPIEHVWKMLKDNFDALMPGLHLLRNNAFDRAIFEAALLEAWEALDQEKVRRCIDSIPARLAAVRAARGWYTSY